MSEVSKKPSLWRQLASLVKHPQETLILVVVSGLDVVMTYTLLMRGDGGFTESNPFARYFLYRWGWAGMAYFKIAMTVLVCVITQIVARKNSALARQVLGLATLIIVAIVIYSVGLHFRHHEVHQAVESDVSVISARTIAGKKSCSVQGVAVPAWLVCELHDGR